MHRALETTPTPTKQLIARQSVPKFNERVGSFERVDPRQERLVAGMNVYGVERLLTFKTADFARFGISLLYPTSL
jgi:hypothetical protein